MEGLLPAAVCQSCQLSKGSFAKVAAKVQASCGQLQRDTEHWEVQPEIKHEGWGKQPRCPIHSGGLSPELPALSPERALRTGN